MEELASVLRREATSVQVLLFKFVEARQLLRVDETRFLGWASSEVERARTRVRELDLVRAAEADRLAVELGVGRDPLTLTALAEVADSPYPTILTEQRRTLVRLLGEIEAIAGTVSALAHQGIARLASSGSEPAARLVDTSVLSQAGTRGPTADDLLSELHQETAYQDVLVTAGRLQVPALVQFLAL